MLFIVVFYCYLTVNKVEYKCGKDNHFHSNSGEKDYTRLFLLNVTVICGVKR